jgi:hypothetical protein
MTMTPQERDVIAGIFDRLKQAANQPRDPEAENYIAERLREQPYAPYAMAQAVYVQEQALTNLQAQVEDLQAQLRDLQNRPAEAPAQAGGFLSGIFGGGAQPQPARPRSVPAFPQRAEGAPSGAWNTQPQAGAMQAAPGQPGMQQPGPWANQTAQQPSRGGGFMASALTTAAGVAGGMMLGNVLTNAFGGHKAGEAKAAETASSGSTAKDDSANTQTASDNSNYNDGSSDASNYQQAAYQEPVDEGYDDGSSGIDEDDDSWA